jgi:hypothetical protein
MIPEQWRKFWQPVEIAPSSLVHYTSPENAKAILNSGCIEPRDPAPRDWHGLKAVFMCDTTDPSYLDRLQLLLTEHFFSKSHILHALEISPQTNLFRCTLPERRSYHIALTPIKRESISANYPFACRIA